MNYKVLLADGEAAFRLMASRFLKAKGLEVVTAINGLDALHKLEQGDFEIVVADWKMPVLDGLGMLTRLLDSPRWGKQHILITLDENAPAGIVAESEHVHSLSKPFSLEKLYTRLCNILTPTVETPVSEPTAAEDALLSSEDSIYLGMMRDMLHENSCLNRLIAYIHEMEKAVWLEDLAQSFYQMLKESLNSQVRLWILKDQLPTPLAENENLPPRKPGTPAFEILETAFRLTETHLHRDHQHFFYMEGVLMEVSEYPEENKHIFPLLMLFFRNFIPVFRSFRDRAYFWRLKEQFSFAHKLKDMIIENLENVRDTSGEFATAIGQSMDQILMLSDQIVGENQIRHEIEDIAVETMNRMQFTDINNQKLFSIAGNLQNMFNEMQRSLDTKDEFFNTSDRINLQEVASESILDKNWQTSQGDVDDLLHSMGM